MNRLARAASASTLRRFLYMPWSCSSESGADALLREVDAQLCRGSCWKRVNAVTAIPRMLYCADFGQLQLGHRDDLDWIGHWLC